MKAPCTLTHLRNGIWLVHHTSPALGTVGVSANAREEALTKMRNELQYRLELCPCSGVPRDTVVLDLEMKAKALANCEVEGTNHKTTPWKEEKGLMEFLRAL
jgi:hypothetical protein